MTRAPLQPGHVRGVWRVLELTEARCAGSGNCIYVVECVDCGAQRRLPSSNFGTRCCQERKPHRRQRCSMCGTPGHRQDGCPKQNDFDPDVPWDRDPETRVLVRLWGEMTLQQVGDLWDLSRERIRQLEERAIAKLARRAKANPRDAAAIRELLATCEQRRETTAEQTQREAPALRGRQSWQGGDEPEEQCA